MKKKYKEYKNLSLPSIERDVLQRWDKEKVFEQSLKLRESSPPWVFYEGPPSANGLPGIHHVMARAIKDLFCRYRTQKGYLVKRKAGWDTHGLPVEIGVEKLLGISKEDIGNKISISEYNDACRKDVMKYKDIWDDLTRKMGYWVDLENPYITFDNKYIESIWYLLSKLYANGLLYRGYSIQPYSPAAGTGLSSHELNQPGCYRMVKDYSVTAQFRIIKNKKSEFIFENCDDVFFLAWTTTPWTLPSNTGLAVGKNIDYILISTYNQYNFQRINVVLAKNLAGKYFDPQNNIADITNYKPGDKNIPWKIIGEYKGLRFENFRYDQLIPSILPEKGDPFRVILGDFVTTDEGTGIVHIAPSFGSDDFRAGMQFNLGTLTMVNKQGRFVDELPEFGGRYVKNEYLPESESQNERPVDVDIIIKLKQENKAFSAEKYEHSYPHCWRTDKPILYYPLDSWFIRTTSAKQRMIELNNTINWKPESTGTGRFGNWLENLQDWNLSRSRYWGIPLPIWATRDYKEMICIGSLAELKSEIEKSVRAGFMAQNPLAGFVEGNMSSANYGLLDLHRPTVDQIVLVSASGEKMYREPDLIDVWFDSGGMPYAQYHYPFENVAEFEKNFPADFIAEGVDQTRGWFFTLHAIAAMVFDSVAFKTVVSNGLVLDKNGNKMSKRLGNAINPFDTIEKFGADATRWYMIVNAQPWDNLKFDIEGIAEVQRKFFGTLFNTYAFFALYANIDGFCYKEEEIQISNRPEIDRWILSELNTLIKQVDDSFNEFEPTRAGRLIQEFVIQNLSNWYVRLSRRRFWKGEYSEDKISAYQTLYQCLETVSQLMAPIAPFFADQLFTDLNSLTNRYKAGSVHLTDFPNSNGLMINPELEQRMQLAQTISSLVLGLRKKVNIRVRQPLQKIMVPVLDNSIKKQLKGVEQLILAEVNVKELHFLSNTEGILIKKIKPNFKTLGPRYGKLMSQISAVFSQYNQQDIANFELTGQASHVIDNNVVNLSLEDVEILSEDIPGWLVASEGNITVALDVTISPQLREEGIARDLINKIQNMRKEQGLEVTDKIEVTVQRDNEISGAILNNIEYICSETLAVKLDCAELPLMSINEKIQNDHDFKPVVVIKKTNNFPTI